MITETKEGKVFVAVISKNRVANVEKIQTLLGAPVTWIVGQGEVEAYLSAGANAAHEGGSLCDSRNKAIDLAQKEQAFCIEVSDDLTKLEFASSKTTKELATFLDVVSTMVNVMKATGFKLAGVAPTANPFFFNPDKPLRTDKFIVGDLIAVAPDTDLRFDTELKLKEDYDLTLQHLHTYGGVSRIDWILASFKHRTNKGGAVDYRNSDREQQAIDYLKNKWVGEITDNSRRPDEILMKWCGSLHASR
jgi:hypothetical protein